MNCHSRPLQLGFSFIPLFYDFFFISGTQSQGYLGGEPPTFLEENCFCLSIRDMLKAEYLSFYTLSRLRFLDRYLIENVANTMSESRFLKFSWGGFAQTTPSPQETRVSGESF